MPYWNSQLVPCPPVLMKPWKVAEVVVTKFAGKVLTVNQAAALPGPTGLAPDNYGLADYFGTLTWEPVTGADRYYGVVYYWNGQSWVFWTQFSTTGQNATSARVGGLQNTYLAWAVIAGDDVSCSGQVPYWGNWSAWAFCYSPIW